VTCRQRSCIAVRLAKQADKHSELKRTAARCDASMASAQVFRRYHISIEHAAVYAHCRYAFESSAAGGWLR